jgi:hypothetical protein
MSGKVEPDPGARGVPPPPVGQPDPELLRIRRRGAAVSALIGFAIAAAWTLGAWGLVTATKPAVYEEPSFAEVADAALQEEIDQFIWIAWFVGLVVIVGSVIFVAHRQLTRGH